MSKVLFLENHRGRTEGPTPRHRSRSEKGQKAEVRQIPLYPLPREEWLCVPPKEPDPENTFYIE
jgi:hypothetical protein